MSRAYDFVVVGIVWLFAIIIHRISIELFTPGSPLYEIATDDTATLNGTARADLWFEFLVVYMPLLVGGGIVAWAIVREYRRRVQTAAQPVRR